MAESPVKIEGGSASAATDAAAAAAAAAGGPRPSAGYKSWKKKYRKMRIQFDAKMHEGEELHKQEDKALALVKRLAVENDRLLDLLLEINNSPQIPSEKQIDVALEPSSEHKVLISQPDRDHQTRKVMAAKRLQDLLSDVPHSSYHHAKETLPSVIDELKPLEGETHPADFLSADDVDNYIYHADVAVDPDTHIPSLAPQAHPSSHHPQHPHLKNPTSVTNWLRKHAPKIFLQDAEGHHADADDGETGHGHGHGHGGGRKTRGGRGERGGRASTRGKRASVAAKGASGGGAGGDWDVSMDDDAEVAVTPATKGKRKRDDDPGYKPRGSSTRPSKKKRKSEIEGTPSVRKSKKETLAASAAAAAASKDD